MIPTFLTQALGHARAFTLLQEQILQISIWAGIIPALLSANRIGGSGIRADTTLLLQDSP